MVANLTFVGKDELTVRRLAKYGTIDEKQPARADEPDTSRPTVSVRFIEWK